MGIKKRNRYAYLFILPFFIIYLIFSFYPIVYSFALSFQEMDPLTGEGTWVGLMHYQRLFTSKFFYQSISNTFVMWIMSIVPQLTIAFVLSLLLSNKWLRGRSVLRNVYYFPNLVTPVTIGLLFGSLFSYPSGSINQLINLLGFSSVDFQNNPFLAQIVIAIAICWKNFGYNIIYFTAGLNSISPEVYEAAEVDGANTWNKTTRITLPMMRPMLLYVMITSVIGGLQMFDESKLVFKSVPGDATTTMVKYMYDSSFERFQFGYGAATSVGIFFVIMLATVVVLLLTRERNKQGGK